MRRQDIEPRLKALGATEFESAFDHQAVVVRFRLGARTFCFHNVEDACEAIELLEYVRGKSPLTPSHDPLHGGACTATPTFTAENTGSHPIGTVRENRPKHHPGCSNQNVLDPEGAFKGVEECGCASHPPHTPLTPQNTAEKPPYTDFGMSYDQRARLFEQLVCALRAQPVDGKRVMVDIDPLMLAYAEVEKALGNNPQVAALPDDLRDIFDIGRPKRPGGK